MKVYLGLITHDGAGYKNINNRYRQVRFFKVRPEN